MTRALIIINMFVRDVEKLRDKRRIIANQLRLIEAFRKRKEKVILIGGRKDGKAEKMKNKVMLRLWGDERSKNPPKNKVASELLAAHHDQYIAKSEYSAFFRTGLDHYCKKHRISELYCCGIFSGVCVYFTAADAAMRGIQPVLVKDASTTYGTKQHQQNCRNFKTVLGPVLTTAQVLKLLKTKKHA